MGQAARCRNDEVFGAVPAMDSLTPFPEGPMNYPARAPRWVAVALWLLVAPLLRAEVPPSAPLSAEETRKAFHRIIDRPKVELAAKVEQDGSKNGFAHFR